MLNIRPATESDLDAILEIVNHNILHSSSIYDYEPRTFEEQKKIWEEKKHQNFPLIIAEIEGKIAGFGTFGTFRFKEGYKFTVEHSVYVSHDFQGKGIGKQLLAELINLAKHQNYHCMIGVIDASNVNSILFHQQFGFENVGELKEVGFKFDKWLDVVFMQKILT